MHSSTTSNDNNYFHSSTTTPNTTTTTNNAHFPNHNYTNHYYSINSSNISSNSHSHNSYVHKKSSTSYHKYQNQLQLHHHQLPTTLPTSSSSSSLQHNTLYNNYCLNKKSIITPTVLSFTETEEVLQIGMHKVLVYVKNHRDAWPFMDPVEEDIAPRYYSIIRR